jgi:hypothetical protein
MPFDVKIFDAAVCRRSPDITDTIRPCPLRRPKSNPHSSYGSCLRELYFTRKARYANPDSPER